jgi:hypothetical protein
MIISDDFKDLLRKIFFEERKKESDDNYLFTHLTETEKAKTEREAWNYDIPPKSALMN